MLDMIQKGRKVPEKVINNDENYNGNFSYQRVIALSITNAKSLTRNR